ncbi:MAG TPA: hypothetical protein VGK99_04375 [Acidobacteriota bacterium]|jgi:GGDEF domain-containing protein
MLIDPKRSPDDLLSILEPKIPCIKRDNFFYFLEQEVARAERYHFYVSLLLIRSYGADQTSLEELADFLSTQLRVTDYLGIIDKATVGIIILNAKPENSWGVLERLKSDFIRAGSKDGPTARKLVATLAVYPTEANSLRALYSTALRRMRREKSFS